MPIVLGILGLLFTLAVVAEVTGGVSSHSSSDRADTTAAAPAVPVPAAATAPTTAPAVHTSAVALKASGSGARSTGTFTVRGDWDLEYSYDCTGSGSAGAFVVNGPAPADRYVDELGTKGSGTTHLHAGGTLRLDVESTCAWTIEVVDV
ncbi:hypothetical protein [Actinacidiphila sp. ITFR-21]|uniref:hypothetical protein n=1 Tax=Actinacidiphila sp. ITFR-21 TaxID=3075199 RepID=UPI00288C1D0C|nr:hypothetical protein [Streptomyces sp. ITFR-21]WNI15350.1 hypothetical protein RLT57_07270 [Streptomyces sp. ITFR-21]